MIYSIDLQNEKLVAIGEVPSLLPRRRGKKTHYQTVWRWATKGINGKILATVKLGGVRYTSVEALRDFLVERGIAVLSSEEQERVDKELARSGM